MKRIWIFAKRMININNWNFFDKISYRLTGRFRLFSSFTVSKARDYNFHCAYLISLICLITPLSLKRRIQSMTWRSKASYLITYYTFVLLFKYLELLQIANDAKYSLLFHSPSMYKPILFFSRNWWVKMSEPTTWFAAVSTLNWVICSSWTCPW